MSSKHPEIDRVLATRRPGIPVSRDSYGRGDPCQARRSGEVEQLEMPLPAGDDDLLPSGDDGRKLPTA